MNHFTGTGESHIWKCVLGGVAAGVGLGLVFAHILPAPSTCRTKSSCVKDIQNEWSMVGKNERGRVDRAAFCRAMLHKHGSKLSTGSRGVYEQFLNKCFDSATALMLPAKKEDLGRHCFSYAALLAGEFYFAAAQVAADASCGCNTPVADVLQLTK